MELYPKLIMDALATVRYPGTGKNIVEMEMVEDDLRIAGMHVSFTLIFDKPTNPFLKSLVKASQNTKIYALIRNKEKALKIFGQNSGIEFVVQDINDEIKLNEKIDYIIHGASATSSAYFVQNPVETIQTAINGTTNILEFARKNRELF